MNNFPNEEILVLSNKLKYYNNLCKNDLYKSKILELGLGSGRDYIYMVQNGFNVVGVDLSKDVTSNIQKKLASKNLKAKLINDYIENCSKHFSNETFDIVYSFNTLSHFSMEIFNGVLEDILEYLDDNGTLNINLLSKDDDDFVQNSNLSKSHTYYDERDLNVCFKKYQIIKSSHIKVQTNIKNCFWSIIAKKR